MKTGYATYVTGNEIFLEAWKLNTGFTESVRYWHWYVSNWRILHIDGFEPGFGNRIIHWDFSIAPRTLRGRFISAETSAKNADISADKN